MISAILKRYLRHWTFGHSSTMLFLKGLEPALRKELQEKHQPVIASINSKAKLLADENQHLVLDGASRGHVEFSSRVLAAYLVLLPYLGNDKDKTVEFLMKAAMQGYNTWILRVVFRLIFSLHRNRPAEVGAIFDWMMEQYGISFGWASKATKESRDNRYELSISRCFYFAFFKSYNAVFLTPILCQLDAIWFEMIDAKKYGFMFDETQYQTQGYGADKCLFLIRND